ncbi:MAG: uroporphyrinogen-III synthase [Nitrospirota bacterium]|jgi:uroporphyrinogen-III synthase
MAEPTTPHSAAARPAVVVTRPGPKAMELIAGLEAVGAEVIPYPVMEIRPPEDPAPLDRACARLDSHDVVLLTSANGVQALASRVAEWPQPGPRIAVVGEQTARAVRRRGWPVDYLPAEANAEGLLAALTATARQPVAGLRFLFPRAEQGREVLVEGLRAAGATVDLVTAYRSVAVPHAPAETLATLGHRHVALVTFTSGACADHFLARMAEAGLGDAARAWPAAVIGPVTRDVCVAHGMRVVAMAEQPSSSAFLAAIRAYLAQRSAFSD